MVIQDSKVICIFSCVDHLRKEDFFHCIVDVVHGTDRCHRITGFQFFCDALRFFHAENKHIHTLFAGLIDFGKVIPECSVQKHRIVKNPAMPLQVEMAHSAIFSDRVSGRVGQGYLWDQVIPTLPICPTHSFKYRFHCRLLSWMMIAAYEKTPFPQNCKSIHHK